MLKGKIIINKFGATSGGTPAVETEMNEILKGLNRDRLVKIYMNNNRDILIVWEDDTPIEI